MTLLTFGNLANVIFQNLTCYVAHIRAHTFAYAGTCVATAVSRAPVSDWARCIYCRTRGTVRAGRAEVAVGARSVVVRRVRVALQTAA